MPEPLKFSNTYWASRLGADVHRTSQDEQLHLLASLLVFLNIPLHRFLHFIFSCEIDSIKLRAGQFMGFHATASQPEDRFRPLGLYRTWSERWPRSRSYLDKLIIQPFAQELALGESNAIISDRQLQVKLKTLTVDGIRSLLEPGQIAARLQELAPFTFDLMHVFAASPNAYRSRRAKAEVDEAIYQGDGFNPVDDESDLESEVADEHEESPDGGSEAEDRDNGPAEDVRFSTAWREFYKGFSRNPSFVSAYPKESCCLS